MSSQSLKIDIRNLHSSLSLSDNKDDYSGWDLFIEQLYDLPLECICEKFINELTRTLLVLPTVELSAFMKMFAFQPGKVRPDDETCLYLFYLLLYIL